MITKVFKILWYIVMDMFVDIGKAFTKCTNAIVKYFSKYTKGELSFILLSLIISIIIFINTSITIDDMRELVFVHMFLFMLIRVVFSIVVGFVSAAFIVIACYIIIFISRGTYNYSILKYRKAKMKVNESTD